MKSGALVFLAAFMALAASWGGFVLAPQVQLSRSVQTNTPGSSDLYPLGRPGLAKQGLEVYRANGCVYCHSQQVGQERTICEIMLTDAGTNAAATAAAIAKLNSALANGDAKELLAGLPKLILQVTDMNAADPALKTLAAAGAKAETRVAPQGADIARGWGKRRTVAQDYLADYPVQLGSRRIGPDLANVGLRLPDADWQLRHLYAPQNEVTGSVMPPYRFLFETRKIGREASPYALKLSGKLAPSPGYEIVPKPEASALVAYLQSLRADMPLEEAPLTPPPGTVTATNATGVSTNAPTTSTNAPPAKPYSAGELRRLPE
jgi:cbb3-type cytochrome oxidase cytochrome c subunit